MKRIKLFPQGELGRLILDVLRQASKPISTEDVVTAMLRPGGHGETAKRAVAPRVQGNCVYLENAGRCVRLETVPPQGGLLRIFERDISSSLGRDHEIVCCVGDHNFRHGNSHSPFSRPEQQARPLRRMHAEL